MGVWPPAVSRLLYQHWDHAFDDSCIGKRGPMLKTPTDRQGSWKSTLWRPFCVSLQGLLESAYKSPYHDGGERQIKLHGKTHIAVHGQIQGQKGMFCQDCHTSIDVRGDAFTSGTNLARESESRSPRVRTRRLGFVVSESGIDNPSEE